MNNKDLNIINKFFRMVTGASKEIELLQLNIKQMSNEKKNFLQKYDQLAESYEVLNDRNNKTGLENSTLKQEMFNLTETNKKVSETNTLYELTLFEFKNKLIDYNNCYGLLVENPQPTEHGSISPYDKDATFFEEIEKIKKNPFNNFQVQAIRYEMEKNLRIIAGAGSGKTETICAKAAYLSLIKKVDESKIGMITFTNKASKEMSSRLHEFMGYKSGKKSKIAIGTFHKIFNDIYKTLEIQYPYLKEFGISERISDVKTKKYNVTARRLIKENKLFDFDKLNGKTIASRVSYWNNMGYVHDEMISFIELHFNKDDKIQDPPLSERFNKMMSDLSEIKKKERIPTFDDYLLNLYYAMLSFPDVLEVIRRKFDYLFIDEFQDTNPLQMKIIELICPPNLDGTKLIIVGDDDQSIYAFRGSSPKFIKTFSDEYETETISLMKNYRSTRNIVQAGNRIIRNNEDDRIDKKMDSFSNDENDLYWVKCKDSSSEADWIIGQSLELGHHGKPYINEEKEGIFPNLTSSVVIYRSKNQITGILMFLTNKKIPFVIEEENDLLGVFNIDDFYNIYQTWIKLMKSPSGSIQAWIDISNNLAYSYFFDPISVGSPFINHNQSNAEICNEIVNYIKVNTKPFNDTTYVNKYLDLLTKSIHDGEMDLQKILDCLLGFPKLKKNLEIEEIEWIREVIKQNNTLRKLSDYYNELIAKKEKMAIDLESYFNGKLNALYLLTIHKSKGLAFENVFIIGCYQGGLPSSRAEPLSSISNEAMRISQEMADPISTLEEERRLIYVAITRAKSNLYLTYPRFSQGKMMEQSEFLSELKLDIKDV